MNPGLESLACPQNPPVARNVFTADEISPESSIFRWIAMRINIPANRRTCWCSYPISPQRSRQNLIDQQFAEWTEYKLAATREPFEDQERLRILRHADHGILDKADRFDVVYDADQTVSGFTPRDP